MTGVVARSFGGEERSTAQYRMPLMGAQSGVTRDQDTVGIQTRRQRAHGGGHGDGHLGAEIRKSAGGDSDGIVSRADGI